MFYCYIIQVETENQISRKLIAKQEKIKISNKIIDQNNKIGIIVKSKRTIVISYIKEVKTIKELEELSKEKQLLLKYNIKEKEFFIIPSKKEKIGVWKDNDLIFHELRLNMNNNNESIFIEYNNNNNNKKDLFAREASVFFRSWESKLVRSLLNQDKSNLELLLFKTFVLTLNDYALKNSKQKEIKHFAICYSKKKGFFAKEIGKVKFYSKQQYKFWICPTLEGKFFYLNSNNDFYGVLPESCYNINYQNYYLKFKEYLKEKELL